MLEVTETIVQRPLYSANMARRRRRRRRIRIRRRTTTTTTTR